jgi:hypothetical protein
MAGMDEQLGGIKRLAKDYIPDMYSLACNKLKGVEEP